MCFFSQPDAPETPAPPAPAAPAAAPLDLKMNKTDNTVSDINKRNREGKRKFRLDKKQSTMTDAASNVGMGSGLQINKV